MPTSLFRMLARVIVFLMILLIGKIVVAVIWGYRNYFPPSFDSEFLFGREGYFFHGYQFPFYLHLATGPLSLVLGLLLISNRFRVQFPGWHRRLGRVQGMVVLLGVAPSGLGMAWHTSTGPIAGAAFVVSALLTAATVVLGWRAAIRKQFAAHRRWMFRCYLLLCSAVVIRVLGGLGTVLVVQGSWYDPAISWLSWLGPLIVFELMESRKRRQKQQRRIFIEISTPRASNPHLDSLSIR